jgi:hypothetical protein
MSTQVALVEIIGSPPAAALTKADRLAKHFRLCRL